MKLNPNRVAAALAFIIGIMAIIAGGQVLLGRDPGYDVINWLVLYNYSMGMLSAVCVAPLIWRNSRLAWPAAMAIFGLHGLATITLLAGYGGLVAVDSLAAMTMRLTTWLIILGLMFLQRRKDKTA